MPNKPFNYHTTNVYSGQEAKDYLIMGVNAVADAVRVTLGAKGTNAILQDALYPYHIVTNDGISIAQKVFCDHPVQAIGANIMKEVADRANKESGDGTTTAIVLAQAIIREGQNAQYNSIELKRSLDECWPLIEQSIDLQTQQITVDDVASVATISAEDEQLGALLQEIFQKITKDGIIEIDHSGTFDTSYTITEGVRLRNAGYLSHYMTNEGNKAIYKNPKILITKQRIATLQDIDPLFQKLSKAGTTELVMFVDEIDPSVTAALAYTHQNGIFKTLIIKAPVLWKDWLYQDFAKITGAVIVEPASGVTLKDVDLYHLGTCDKLTTSRDETVVVGIKDISAHIAELQVDSNEEMKLRASWLNTKAAILKLGASSESELSYKRLKAEDARNAAWLALQGGVVPGGGVTLRNAALLMPETPGGKIMRVALRAPIKQVIENAGAKDMVSDYAEPNTVGFDASDCVVKDMLKAKIIDPAKVTKNSVRNAISIAGTILTAKTVVTLSQAPKTS